MREIVGVVPTMKTCFCIVDVPRLYDSQRSKNNGYHCLKSTAYEAVTDYKAKTFCGGGKGGVLLLQWEMLLGYGVERVSGT